MKILDYYLLRDFPEKYSNIDDALLVADKMVESFMEFIITIAINDQVQLAHKDWLKGEQK